MNLPSRQRPSGPAGVGEQASRPPRLLLALALAAAALALLAPPAAAASPPPITAPSAFVIETSTRDVAYQRAADRRRPIASATKLMTALLVLERTRLSSELRAARYRPAPVESQIGLEPGERMSVADLLRALLLESANDAAVALAVGVSGSRSAFVRAMNRRARQLDLDGTRFANPIGLDDGRNYSTARDLAHLALRLRRFAFFRRTVDQETAELKTGARPRTVRNRNDLLGRRGWIDGIKTGHTQGAGYVLVGSSTRRRVSLVSVVLGTSSEAARDADTLALLRWAGRRYRRVTPVERGSVLASVPIRYRRGAQVDLVARRGVSVVVERGQRLTTRLVDVPDEVSGPLRKGERVARIHIRVDGRKVRTVGLVSAASVPAAGITQQAKSWVTRPLVSILALAAVVGAVGLAVRRRRGASDGPRRPARSAGAA